MISSSSAVFTTGSVQFWTSHGDHAQINLFLQNLVTKNNSIKSQNECALFTQTQPVVHVYILINFIRSLRTDFIFRLMRKQYSSNVCSAPIQKVSVRGLGVRTVETVAIYTNRKLEGNVFQSLNLSSDESWNIWLSITGVLFMILNV